MSALPLDEAALIVFDGLLPEDMTEAELDSLIAQARAALALKEAAEAADARANALAAQVERLTELLDRYVSHDEVVAREFCQKELIASDLYKSAKAALALTPADALAARDAAVRAKALREAADICISRADDMRGFNSEMERPLRAAACAILATAQDAKEGGR